jgi:acetylornithine deacetylase/succinyl-diaminopimelate desuccinylase-like protein
MKHASIASTLLALLVSATGCDPRENGETAAPEAGTAAQQIADIDWSAVEAETLQHFQTLVRFDSSDPPGFEREIAEYLRDVMVREGIDVELFALEADRPNVVARLRGNGSRRPLLIMAHTDVVNVDPEKWTFPPFSATRDGGYIYGRGTVDDKDNVVAGLMTMLLLKRNGVPLDRDVIFLAEAGEEGSVRVGIKYLVENHLSEIEAEFCLAEGGGVTRRGGEVRFASVQTTEKIPRAIELTANGTAGHGSVPLLDNAILRLSEAVGRIGRHRPEVRLNETTRAYFERLSEISGEEQTQHYIGIRSGDPARVAAADSFFLVHEPRHASMIRNSISPNIFQGGYRVNVIPSEAKATLDVRLLSDEDPDRFLEEVRRIVADPEVEVEYAARDVRPGAPPSRLDSEAFLTIERNIQKHYGTLTLPTMSTGATDMAYVRAQGIQCFGIGPALDFEDGALGFGAHSDQERILESELYRFVRFHWEVVRDLAMMPSMAIPAQKPASAPSAEGS